MKKAIARYKKFHGTKPKKITTVDIPYPNELVYLGECVAVEYLSDKPLEGKPKRKRVYRHPFGKSVRLYTDPEGKALYIAGGRLRVNDWIRN